MHVEAVTDAGSSSPGALIDLAKATYAVALARRHDMSKTDIAHLLDFVQSRPLSKVIAGVFGRSLVNCQVDQRHLSQEAYLEYLVVRKSVAGINSML